MAQKTYDRQTAAFIARVVENIPTDLTNEQIQAYIQKPKKLQRALRMLTQLLLVDGCKPIVPWRKLTVGGKSLDDLIKALKPYSFDEYWENMMRHEDFINPEVAQEVLTTLVTPRDMGFVAEPTLDQLLTRAKECGLTWHPAIGPYLRLDYHADPLDEYFYFPMRSIVSGTERESIFVMDRAKEDGGVDGRYFWDMPMDREDYDDQEPGIPMRIGLGNQFVFILPDPNPPAE